MAPLFAAGFNIAPVVYIIQMIGGFLLQMAPALLVLSFATSAFLWVFSGSSQKMVKMARQQFVATCVSCLIIGGYFLFKAILLGLSLSGFGV